jgi:hypothetical protein
MCFAVGHESGAANVVVLEPTRNLLAARKYAQYAFQAVVLVAMTAKSETARVIAAKELLEAGRNFSRRYGKVPEAPLEEVEVAPSQSGR